MKKHLSLCLILGFALMSQAAKQPNIIVLLADDLGYGELSCQGNSEIPTPHIDSIAKNGIRFTQAYVTGANCSPSRAGFLTGRIPTRFGYEFNPIGHKNELPGVGMPKNEITIAEMLHEVGYTTGLIGKWHQGGSAEFHPHRHGFDEFFGFTHEGHYFVPPPYKGVTTMLRRRTNPGNTKGRWGNGKLWYTTHMGHNEPDYDANNPIVRSGQPVEEHEYLTDALTREAVDFIDRHNDKPFFLYLAYNAVHSPLQGADKYMRKYSHIEDLHRRIFAAMLGNLDDSVGDVLKAVRKNKIEEDTLVIFLSDNGGPTRELTSSNAPLKGEKSAMYEGGIRVPFMLQWKGKLPERKTDGRFIVTTDIFATAAAISGGKPARGDDGVNLMPYLTGQKNEDPHDFFYWRQGPRTAVRQGPWKLLNMKRKGAPEWELYNIPNDISEESNLAATNPTKLKEMVELWEKTNSQMTEALFK